MTQQKQHEYIDSLAMTSLAWMDQHPGFAPPSLPSSYLELEHQSRIQDKKYEELMRTENGEMGANRCQAATHSMKNTEVQTVLCQLRAVDVIRQTLVKRLHDLATYHNVYPLTQNDGS